MQNQIFRKKSLDRVSSPDQLDDYIHVTQPSVWIIFAAVVVLLLGACVWGALGYLDTTSTVPAYADAEHGLIELYIKEKNAPYIHPGTVFTINGHEYTVDRVDGDAVRMEMANGADKDMLAYALHVGDMVAGEWVYCAYADADHQLAEGIYEAAVVLERVHPMTFILN